jgi:amino acid transporter
VGTPGAYANVIKQATSNGYVPGSTFNASLLALPFGIQSLTGWQFSSYLGGEVKTPTRKLPMSIILALIINGIFYILLFNAMYSGLGYDFANASVYLQTFYPKLYPSSNPALLPYLMVAMPVNPALIVFAVFSFFVAAVWLVVTYFPFSTRNILAWSFDGVTPSIFADVSDKFGTPTKAVALSLVFSILGVLVAYYTGWASVTSNLIVGYNFMLTVVMLCAITFPFTAKGRALLAAAPPFAKQKIGPVPILVLFGAIGAVGTGFTFYSGLTNPLVGGAITPSSGGFVLSLFILPVIIYYVSKAYRKSKGLDLSLAFKQLPPE